jgi:putative nucleotidyltransferase with HDIG domain
VSAPAIGPDAAARLGAFIANRRQTLVAAVLSSPALSRSKSLPVTEWTEAFVERLCIELRAVEEAGAPPDTPGDRRSSAEPARIATIACAVISAAYIAECGYCDEAMSYLATRASEVDVPEPIDAAEHDEFVTSLLSALEVRDPATCEHSRAVGMWCSRIAKTMGLDAEQQALAALAGTLHDVGKIAMPTEILLKRAALDEAEWETMRTHSRIGAKMLERVPSLGALAPIVRAHHERIDGRGYPDGIAGEAIPLFARIIAVSDSFHAMISKQPYREALTIPAAMDELRAGVGTQFDPLVVESILKIMQPTSTRRPGRASRSISS